MSFKNLEQRFNENVNTLYAGATSKFDGGKPSNNREDEPFITRAPGKGYWGAMESRSTPIQSTTQDLKRLTLFQLSPRGLQFLAKQQLLQTGNTFKFTRILNPAFVVGNAVPFLHIKRNLRPLNELVGKTDTSYENVRKMGTMQTESYDRLRTWKQPQFIATHLNISKSNKSSSLLNRIGGIIGSVIKNSVANKLSQAFSPIINTISAFNPTLKRNVGEEKSWSESRPELANNSIIQSVETANVNYQVSTDDYFKTELKEATGTKFIKYFSAPDGIQKQSSRTDTQLKTVQGNQASIVKAATLQNTKKISYIKDPSNRPIADYASAYSAIPSSFDDPINVSFIMGKDAPVRFRAFIKDLVETSTPQYQPLQYIGRIEKFINYTGVQREISFKLAVLAYSNDELETVWRRINFLTGLTFPYGFTRGIMQPNIVRISIGNVYVNQPGYITSLTTNFNEPAGSWDIDEQVPIGAMVDMRFNLIENATKVSNSPFYGITHGADGFVSTLNIPQQLPAEVAPVRELAAMNVAASNTTSIGGLPGNVPITVPPSLVKRDTNLIKDNPVKNYDTAKPTTSKTTARNSEAARSNSNTISSIPVRKNPTNPSVDSTLDAVTGLGIFRGFGGGGGFSGAGGGSTFP